VWRARRSARRLGAAGFGKKDVLWGEEPVGRDEPKLGRREALSVVVAVMVVVVVRLRFSRLQFVSSAGEEQ
jgi:hypothetical protein